MNDALSIPDLKGDATDQPKPLTANDRLATSQRQKSALFSRVSMTKRLALFLLALPYILKLQPSEVERARWFGMRMLRCATERGWRCGGVLCPRCSCRKARSNRLIAEAGVGSTFKCNACAACGVTSF